MNRLYKNTRSWLNGCKQGLFSIWLFACSTLFAQERAIDRQSFLFDNSYLQMTLISDFTHLQGNKEEEIYQPATIILQFADSSVIKDEISIKSRGIQRKKICAMPPLMLLFNNDRSKYLKKLGRLKLVVGCNDTYQFEQLIFKEFLTYRIYNLLTEKSFRVRLVQIHFRDAQEKMKPVTQYGFFIEDVDDMAHRNNCRETAKKYQTEQTNRKQMTLLALFQYMIGNTDWEVSVNRNIKLIAETGAANAAPYAVPYDFDYAGLVNAGYAIPHPYYEIEFVTQRVYKGFRRTPEELEEAMIHLRNHKDSTYSLIRNFPMLSQHHKTEMLNYLEGFFFLVKNKNFVTSNFIDHARRE
jgi:hypothetical protein